MNKLDWKKEPLGGLQSRGWEIIYTIRPAHVQREGYNLSIQFGISPARFFQWNISEKDLVDLANIIHNHISEQIKSECDRVCYFGKFGSKTRCSQETK